MKHGALAGLLLLLSAWGAVAAPDQRSEIAHDGQAFDEIARGRYLTTVGDCSACHTQPAGRAFAGGRAIVTPFGTLLSANLTPDRETGIGGWSDDDFVNALLQGRGQDGQHLYPAMPYTYYTRMSRDDVLAIRAYLNTIEPVRNEVVTDQLPFPLSIRASVIVWNALFFRADPFQPDAQKSEAWNRGAYLVEGPAHCGMCHTSKNLLGADKKSQALHGGVLQGWFAPDISGDPHTGLGSWSADDIVSYLKTGHNPISAASGPMSEVVADSTTHMSDADLAAIAAYLKDQPGTGQAPPPPLDAHDPVLRNGEAIYVDVCAACHAGAGTGVANLFPALKDNPEVQSVDPTSLIRVVLHGTRSVATDAAPTRPAMPALGWKLSDPQVAAVLTYIRNSWGNRAKPVDPDQVRELRAVPTE